MVDSGRVAILMCARIDASGLYYRPSCAVSETVDASIRRGATERRGVIDMDGVIIIDRITPSFGVMATRRRGAPLTPLANSDTPTVNKC